ncbi:hypothetical protein V502_06852 [Pseudogymnoascus sp. VKM F-4520 (FW-2644)]|nr:hypothetical protein V502_06852 [Pseudogymnoascus sp. VKM F-4520 (FW-2644)]
MVHVIATCPDGEEMVVLVEKSMVRKATSPPKPLKQYTYTVTRETIDSHYQDGDIEILGTYETLAAANRVARNNMTEEWGEHCFDDFEVEVVDGMVRVDAVFLEGERMAVRIEKTEVEKYSMARKAVAQNRVAEARRHIEVYHVVRETIDYHNDPHGGAQNTTINGTYVSLEKANEAAGRDLDYDWDRDFFEEYNEMVKEGMVTINTTCPEGERINVYVKRGSLTTDHAEMAGLVEEIVADMEDELDDELEDGESEDGSEEE